MNFLAVVPPPSIYHGCSTRKTFWEEKFTGKEDFFLSVNMKNVVISISGNTRLSGVLASTSPWTSHPKFDTLDKMKITSSESKVKLERSGKGLITSLGFQAKARSQKYKKARYAIVNVIEKDISKIIREFEKFEKLLYENKRPKFEPTESYFQLSRQLAKCMMRSDTLNWYNHGGYTKMTDPYSNVNVTNKSK